MPDNLERQIMAEEVTDRVTPRPGGTRAEHLAWCKFRALEYLDSGDLTNAVTSMISDLGKHDETRSLLSVKTTAMLLVGGLLRVPDGVRAWIDRIN